MKILEDRIKKDGRVLGEDVLKVDNFLNHQVDPQLMKDMGDEFARLFDGEKIDKVFYFFFKLSFTIFPFYPSFPA